MAANNSARYSLSGVPSDKLLRVLLGFRRTKKFCDITLVSGEKNFYAHSCVLAAVSPYFMGLLRSGMSEVTSNVLKVDLAFLSVCSSSVNSVLDYIYGNEIEVNLDNVFELLSIADYLLLTDLKDELCKYLSLNMTVDHCLLSKQFAEMYGCKSLYEYSDRFLKTRFYQLSQTTSFCELSLAKLEDILASDDLAANEKEILHSIVKWVNFSPETRKEFLNPLLQHIRLDSISEEDIHQILVTNNLLTEASGDSKTPYHRDASGLSSAPPSQDGRMGQHVVLAFSNPQCRTVTSTKTTMCYLPLSKDWYSIHPMPKPRQLFKAAVLNGLVYILGGMVDCVLTLKVWCYNPETNQWSEVAPMLKTASSFGVASLCGHLYAVGGPKREYNVQRYDPVSNCWCFESPMQVQRDEHCVAAFQDKYMFAIGGYTSNVRSVEKYDVQSNTWTNMADLNIGRIGSSAVALGDKIFVVGGYGGAKQQAIKNCEVYRSLTKDWGLIASTHVPRQAAGISVVCGQVYIFGGSHGKYLHIESYCEGRDTWDRVAMLVNASQQMNCCTVVLSGKAMCKNITNKIS